VGEAFVWGAFAASAVLIGAAITLVWTVERTWVGAIMAFGSGVLISAVANELVTDEFIGHGSIGLGLLCGAFTFYIGDRLIGRMGGEHRKKVEGATGEGEEGSPLAIVLGTVLDGIPESIVLGVSLTGGGGVSAAVVAAVFLSNLPEGLASTSGLVRDGWSHQRVLLLWGTVTLVCAIASAAGFVALDDAPVATIGFVQAFAGGALLTMLADTMMPDALRYSGKQAGIYTTTGFALAFWISALE
jgi:ZIP family zinc transporter